MERILDLAALSNHDLLIVIRTQLEIAQEQIDDLNRQMAKSETILAGGFSRLNEQLDAMLAPTQEMN